VLPENRMPDGGQQTRRKVRYLWEALFSLHLASLGVATVSEASFAVFAALSRMEAGTKILLHVRQTDYVSGYIALWLPSVLVGLLIWIVLRISGRTRITQKFLGSLAGIITIVGPFALWVPNCEEASWPVGWIYGGAPFETTAALVCALRFLSGRWRVPSWAGLLLLASHYAFWYFARFAPNANPSGFCDPGAFVTPLGFCAATAWGIYVRRLREVEAVGTSLVS